MSNGAKGATVLAVALALWASAGVAANSVDEPRKPDGSTPLQWAVFEANIPEAERLVKAGADVSATNNYGINPMLLAADIANTRLIDLLLKAGASAKSANPDGETALHLVARAGNLEAAKMLLKAGAVVDAREKLGQQTALMWAVARRHPEMVELLINSGADINTRGAIRDYQRVATAESRDKQLHERGGLTPLLYAARENCRECADILLKHGADVDKPDPTGVSPLVFALMNSNWDIAKRLVEAGADVNQWDMYGQSPLAVAIGGMNTANGRNPLDDDHPNTATGPELVQMLIARGANPNQQTYFSPVVGRGGGRGTTPFMAAISSGNLELVKQLLAKGANPRLATSEGQGPIILAVQSRGGGGGGGGGGFGGGGRGGGPPGGFGGGAPGGAPPGGGPPPADLPSGAVNDVAPTAQVPRPASAPALAAPPPAIRAAAGAAPAGGPARGGGPPGGGRGAGPGAGGPGGGAGGAARGGSSSTVDMIKLLAAAGADVHLVAHRHFLQRTRGGSAMHFAVRSGGNHQVIEALLDLGVDINAKDEDGLTALDYAMGRGYVPFLQMPQPPNNALADYLRSKGANVELDKTPDWPPQGPPIATVVYDSVIWPVDPIGP
jgi:ankyrin repeat protein